MGHEGKDFMDNCDQKHIAYLKFLLSSILNNNYSECDLASMTTKNYLKGKRKK